MPSNHVEFTREMREAGYTILVPNMLEFHFSLIVKVLRLNGYNAELLTNSGPNVMAEGLKYVHNDTCVPALLVIGQFLDALHSGKYDINKVALIITQTGGGCRASNYIYLLRKALKKAGLEQVPVISVNMSGLESASGFKLTLPLVRQIVASLVYGDCIMCVSNQTRPYEFKKGTTDALIEKWNDALIEQARREGRRIIVLVGRPYHVDPEINHGIDKLIAGFGAAVVTEDSLSWHMQKQAQGVLNQWTYHARLYAAARYITTQRDMNLVQLVSFGCGVDAITTDEVREILESRDKIYTQIKIDEITNLGAVRIRLRSLFAAIDQQQALAAQK